MQKIKVSIQTTTVEEYIYLGHKIQKVAVAKIKAMKYDKIVFVADRPMFNMQKNYIKKLYHKCEACNIIFINPDHHFKDFSHCEHFLQRLIVNKLNRKSCLVALGGGYVADMVGYIASVFMRGIDFIQIPTTLMSMSDPVIGKVAINYGNHKNLLGSFYSPRFVFIDTYFLRTLPIREKFFGLVEIWKHALLVADKDIIKKIENYLVDPKEVDETKIIIFSIKVKSHFVVPDYQDTLGVHKALSLGHTFANYFEIQYDLRHGPAVFYGIILATLLSCHFEMIDEGNLKNILKTAKLFENKIGLLKDTQSKLHIAKVINKLKFNKINQGNLYTFVLLTKSGYCVKKGIGASSLNTILEQFKKLKL